MTNPQPTFYISPELTPQELAMLPNYGSSSGSCSSSCASGCTEKKTTKFPENNPRYQWTIDDTKATITLTAKINLTFKNALNSQEPLWTKTRIDKFEADYPTVVEGAWNAKGFVLVPQNKQCCPAIKYTPKLRVIINDEANALRVVIINGTKSYKIGGKDKTNTTKLDALFTGNKFDFKIGDEKYSGALLENSILSVAKQTPGKCNGVKQVVAAHEFGHLIGLDHPGQDLREEIRPKSNSPEDYEADVKALMGCGTELRIQYFNVWKNQLNEKRKECCGMFLIEAE